MSGSTPRVFATSLRSFCVLTGHETDEVWDEADSDGMQGAGKFRGQRLQPSDMNALLLVSLPDRKSAMGKSSWFLRQPIIAYFSLKTLPLEDRIRVDGQRIKEDLN